MTGQMACIEEAVMQRSGPTLAEQVNGLLARIVPRIGDLGIEVVDLEVGRVVTRAPLGTNGNHLGSMYAGTLFGMAEMMGGVLMYPSFNFTAYLPTVKEVDIRFRRPARTDITGTAVLDEPTLERISRETADMGRSEYVVSTTLTDAGGEVVATAVGTYQMLAMRLAGQRGGDGQRIAPE
jgi:acyl-coenzyme A thioesterase PaaI-like protein